MSDRRLKRTVFIPLFQRGWHTRAVLEGVSRFIEPEAIHIASLPTEITALQAESTDWDTAPLVFHDEETFFGKGELSKASLCQKIAALPKLYQPGWFYQQMLKLGCQQAIPELCDWTLIWDSDLIPLNMWSWQIDGTPAFALLQHKSKGNSRIVEIWESWIRRFAGVEPATNPTGTFTSHHMWFPRQAVGDLLKKLSEPTGQLWQHAIIESLNTHETFSEFWIVASWLAAKYPEQFAFHPYEVAGESTERFFEDGRGKLTIAFKAWFAANGKGEFPDYPAHSDLLSFISHEYRSNGEAIPSSLSLEASTRHIMKDEANRHLEEVRSRWIVRQKDAEMLGICLD